MPTQPRPIICERCHRTLFMLVSDWQTPCFRDIQEQADCLEIRERRANGERISDLTICDALRRSLDKTFASVRVEVEAVTLEGSAYVVRHVPGRPSPLYSASQARSQAEMWDRYGLPNLANQFREAAREAEQRISARPRGMQERFWLPVALAMIVGGFVGIASEHFSITPLLGVAEPPANPTVLQAASQPKVPDKQQETSTTATMLSRPTSPPPSDAGVPTSASLPASAAPQPAPTTRPVPIVSESLTAPPPGASQAASASTPTAPHPPVSPPSPQTPSSDTGEEAFPSHVSSAAPDATPPPRPPPSATAAIQSTPRFAPRPRRHVGAAVSVAAPPRKQLRHHFPLRSKLVERDSEGRKPKQRHSERN
jgi:hypothetical protein